MRTGLWGLATATALAATACALPAAAYESDWEDGFLPWSGAGYYVVDDLAGIDAGPFSDKAGCEAAIAANIRPDARNSYMCLHFTKDFNTLDPDSN